MFMGQGSTPVRSIKGFWPALAIAQYADPELEYDPAVEHDTQVFEPPVEYVEAAHDSQLLLVFDAYLPAPQY
jgi:hypothetical protein